MASIQLRLAVVALVAHSAFMPYMATSAYRQYGFPFHEVCPGHHPTRLTGPIAAGRRLLHLSAPRMGVEMRAMRIRHRCEPVEARRDSSHTLSGP